MYRKKYHQGGLTQNGQNVLLSFTAITSNLKNFTNILGLFG